MLELLWVLYGAGYLILAVVFLFIAKKLFDLLTPYSVNVQLTEKDNPAVGILLTGFLLGVMAVICGVFMGEDPWNPSIEVFLEELGPVVVYSLLGMVLLFLAGIINDRVVLREFSNQKEIIENRNTAVAVIMAASYFGSGLIIAGGIRGSVDVISAIVSFLLGQILMVLFAIVYQLATRYNDQQEIGLHKNVAAGLAFAGNILAYSLILMRGVAVDPRVLQQWHWDSRMIHFSYYALAGCVLLIFTRFVNDRLFLPNAKISDEIVNDRNVNAGLMEAGLAISMGVALIFCL